MSECAIIETATPAVGVDLSHLFCLVCHYRYSFCGLAERPPVVRDSGRDRCVVCFGMRHDPCPNCGAL